MQSYQAGKLSAGIYFPFVFLGKSFQVIRGWKVVIFIAFIFSSTYGIANFLRFLEKLSANTGFSRKWSILFKLGFCCLQNPISRASDLDEWLIFRKGNFDEVFSKICFFVCRPKTLAPGTISIPYNVYELV